MRERKAEGDVDGWMRTMRREAGEECWEDLEELAQDRWWWHEFIEALCIPQGEQELID